MVVVGAAEMKHATTLCTHPLFFSLLQHSPSPPKGKWDHDLNASVLYTKSAIFHSSSIHGHAVSCQCSQMWGESALSCLQRPLLCHKTPKWSGETCHDNNVFIRGSFLSLCGPPTVQPKPAFLPHPACPVFTPVFSLSLSTGRILSDCSAIRLLKL